MENSEEKKQVLDEKSSYTEQTSRIIALSQFIKSITPLIWIVVIFIVAVKLLGGISIHDWAKSDKNPEPIARQPTEIIVPSIDYSRVDSEVITAVKAARVEAEEFASKNLNSWISELNTRVDNDFLNWYFDYFTQLYLGAKGISLDVTSLITRRLSSETSSVQEQKAEALTEEFQREFTKRVLKPEIAQLKLERFTRETINDYVSELAVLLSGVQSKYEIPQADWERYLSGVSATVFDSSGNGQNLPLRALSRGTEYMVAVPLTKATVKLGGGLATKFAEAGATKATLKATSKITTKIATKSAGKVAGEFSLPTLSTLGLELIDPLAALGILAWDVWDNYHTAQVERPKMREAIVEYLDEMKMSLLYNPKDSIMSTIYHFEEGLIDSLNRESDLP
jgi:hypothetical protein